jgi:hypothetical protein
LLALRATFWSFQTTTTLSAEKGQALMKHTVTWWTGDSDHSISLQSRKTTVYSSSLSSNSEHHTLLPALNTTTATRSTTNDPKRIPNILIAGVQKGGTTSLSAYLSKHKDICNAQRFEGEPEYFTKEVHFFNMIDRHKHGLDFYRHRFQHCENDIPFIIDSTPDYFLVPELVHQGYTEHGTTDELKIIFSLRNPVERLVSRYNHAAGDYMNNKDNPPQWAKDALWLEEEGRIMTFEESIQPNLQNPSQVDKIHDMYHDLLVRWTNLFDRQQVLVLSFDELVVNASSALQRVHSFLNLPVHKKLNIPHVNGKSIHKSTQLESVKVPCEIQEQVMAAYAPYNEKLYTLLEKFPGTEWEQYPFPKFSTACNPKLKVFQPIVSKN